MAERINYYNLLPSSDACIIIIIIYRNRVIYTHSGQNMIKHEPAAKSRASEQSVNDKDRARGILLYYIIVSHGRSRDQRRVRKMGYFTRFGFGSDE